MQKYHLETFIRLRIFRRKTPLYSFLQKLKSQEIHCVLKSLQCNLLLKSVNSSLQESRGILNAFLENNKIYGITTEILLYSLH